MSKNNSALKPSFSIHKTVNNIDLDKPVKAFLFEKNLPASLGFLPFYRRGVRKNFRVFKNPPKNPRSPYNSKLHGLSYSFKTLISLYTKYSVFSSSFRDRGFLNLLRRRFVPFFQIFKPRKNVFQEIYNYKYDYSLFKNAYSATKQEPVQPVIFSIYVILRLNNIFVTVIKGENEVKKVFSSGLLPPVHKKNRKRSPSFFYTIKRTLAYLRPFINARRKPFLFKLIFKGIKVFRRPLIYRFLYNKRFKKKCIGIFNKDFEPFNGCRDRKVKRIKRKRKKR